MLRLHVPAWKLEARFPLGVGGQQLTQLRSCSLSGTWEFQDRKTAIYKDFVADGTAVLRPGIQRLIDETHAIPVS